MRTIEVACGKDAAGWTCHVSVSEGASRTDHRVRVDRATLRRLAPGATDPGELVRASFDFLLAREPKESILGAFDLPLIGRYFPEYEAEMVRLAGA